MNCSFGKITDLSRGSLFAMLSDAYSFDARCAENWGADWRKFDDFFFDNPSIAERYGFTTVMDGVPIGFVSWDPRRHPEYEEIGHNCILTRYKGRGFGKIQMKEAVRRIAGDKPAKIIVTTSGIMLPAQKMYESAGFKKVRVRENNHFSGDLIDYEILLEKKNPEILQKKLANGITQILGENLVGVYVHGSLAFGCFRWEVSDFDFLIVVRNGLSDRNKRELMNFLLELDHRSAPPKGLEMSVVRLEDCRNVKHPAPFQLHYSHMHTAWYQRNPADYIAKMNGTDPDLCAYFAVIRQCGIVLCGAPVETVFGEVPTEFVLDSFQHNLEDGNDPAAVLNRCRFEAYRQKGILLSKLTGGEWVLTHLPEAEHAKIRAALLSYQPAEIRELSADDLVESLFDGFNRHQEVTECWRRENGKWLLKPIAFVEEWDRSHLGTFCEELRHTIQSGGAVSGAFSAGKLIGFAGLENSFFGKSCRYLQMSELHVSCEWRGCGIGQKLFQAVCKAARKRGAEKLYISGHSSKETQAFYRAMGCCETQEYNERLVEKEPCDCQLEYKLRPS